VNLLSVEATARMPKKKRKTETIKKRRVDVYLRSLEQKEAWNRYANEKGLPLSKLIFSVMENHMHPLEKARDDPYTIQKVLKLTDQNQELSKEVERLRKLLDTQEEELRRHRSQPLQKAKLIRYDALIDVLKSTPQGLSFKSILENLGIPEDDDEAVGTVTASLNTLLDQYRIVDYDPRSKLWMWRGVKSLEAFKHPKGENT